MEFMKRPGRWRRKIRTFMRRRSGEVREDRRPKAAAARDEEAEARSRGLPVARRSSRAEDRGRRRSHAAFNGWLGGGLAGGGGHAAESLGEGRLF
jgi:hypothetical protein